MKKTLIIASVCIAAFALIFFSFAPEPRTNAVKEWGRRISNDSGQGCVDYTRKKLKDSSSIRLIEWHKINDSEVILKYKATNSYGAYVEGTQKCIVDDKGVNEAVTQSEEHLDDLKRQVAEINERKSKNSTKR